jgi:NitT/TauT family transport system substrate-binding protein
VRPPGSIYRLIRTFVRTAILAAALFSLSACRRSASMPDLVPGRTGQPLARIILQTDWYAQADHGGFYQALAKGYYREVGLDVTIRPAGPGLATGQLLSTGRVQFAIGRGDEALVQVARDIPIVVVAAQMEHDPLALLIHAESPVKSFQDLQGKAVMTSPGANWIAYVQLTQHVKFSVIPLNFGMAQFMVDPNYIQQCFVTNEPYYVERNGGHARTILIAESGFDPYRVIMGNADFVKAHPNITRAFVEATLRGYRDYIYGDPTPGNRLIMAANVQMNEDFIAYGIRAIKAHHLLEGDPAKGDAIGRISRRRLQEQIDALQKIGALDRTVTPDEVADFRFTPPE